MLSDNLENILVEYIYERKAYGPSARSFFYGAGIPEEFIKLAKRHGLTLNAQTDDHVVKEAFWRLVAKGLLVPEEIHGSNGQIDIAITSHGVYCFENGQIQVHDPHGYLADLAKRIPTLDSIIRMYIEQALGSFTNGNYLACAVMIGGALEKLIMNVIADFGERLSDDQKERYFKKVLKQDHIKKRFEEFMKFFEAEGFKAGLEQTLKEKLDTSFPAIINIIRITRNEVGHPTGRIIDPEEAEAYLLLAKEALLFANALMAHVVTGKVEI